MKNLKEIFHKRTRRNDAEFWLYVDLDTGLFYYSVRGSGVVRRINEQVHPLWALHSLCRYWMEW